MASQVLSISFDHWAVPYGIPAFLLADNGLQFVSQFFKKLCTFFEVNRLTITTYHPKTDGQAEHYNKTIVARLRHTVAKNQRD